MHMYDICTYYFSKLLFISIVFFAIPLPIVDKRSPYADLKDTCFPLALTTILFTVFSVCIVIPKLELQYLTFIIQVVIRSFLYGLSVAVIPIMYVYILFFPFFVVFCYVTVIWYLHLSFNYISLSWPLPFWLLPVKQLLYCCTNVYTCILLSLCTNVYFIECISYFL